MMSNYSIELRDIVKAYKKNVVALNKLSLSVPKGCIFGFVGPNGAGKSTTINIMANILRKNSGTVRILGEVVEPGDYAYKRRVGFLLEHPTYVEKLTIAEYLDFVGRMYGIDDSERSYKMNELIDHMDLRGKKDALIETLSMGMKKKVSLSAAFIHEPELLILDEPFESIDPLSASMIKSNFSHMKRKGITIFMSSHHLDTIERVCDEVAIVQKGENVFQSRAEDLKGKVKDELTKERYQSLEEIFIDVVSGDEGNNSRKFSWL
jgi:ABC-2 type transport system ATP-binding protein